MTAPAIDHKTLVANLSDEQRLRLTTKSDRAGIMNFLTHVIGLIVTGSWIVFALPIWQAAMLIHGIQIVFLFTLLHETVHETPFSSPFLSRIAGWICGILIILPPVWFRYFHLAHHRYTHNPEKDPELEGAPIDSVGRYLWAVTGISVWKFHIATLFANACGKSDYHYLPKSAADRTRREAQVMIALYFALIALSWYLASAVLFWVWILPMLLGQPFLRLYLMAEHGRCPHVANMLENTRTTFTNRIVRWLAWNMPYHAEHHAYPSVPFHKLPEFHKVAKEHLRVTENGYTAFHTEHLGELAKGNST
ncbi:MAG: fatty acid desaturase [Pseudomonadota bacterium]